MIKEEEEETEKQKAHIRKHHGLGATRTEIKPIG